MKKKNNDFHLLFSEFVSAYLRIERNYSENTIDSYKASFKLLIEFLDEKEHIRIEKITFNIFSRKLINEFLEWLEKQRKCSIRTRNSRLSAIKSFFKYVQYENIELLGLCNEILSIRQKKHLKTIVEHLSVDEIDKLLQLPDQTTKTGFRDFILLKLMYETAGRVSEIISLTPSCFNFKKKSILLTGKGNKQRPVPMFAETPSIIKDYITYLRLDRPNFTNTPIFHNPRKEKISRQLAHTTIKKYIKIAKKKYSELFKIKVSCHVLRHSKATHLLNAGISLTKIMYFLGHKDISTTQMYARHSYEDIVKELEKTYPNLKQGEEEGDWKKNRDKIEYLKNLYK